MAEGFVYLIQSESGHYKIGKTTGNPESRMRTLKTGCPFPILLIHKIHCEDCAEFERICHARFSAKRAHGEWFLLDADDLFWIKGISFAAAGEDFSDFEPSWEERCSDEVENADHSAMWCDLTAPLWGPL